MQIQSGGKFPDSLFLREIRMIYLLWRMLRPTRLIFILPIVTFSPGFGQVFKTQKEALQQAFPESDSITRKVIFLTKEQVNEIQKLAKAKVKSKVVTYYIGSKANKVIGYAFFETNIVRTKPETFMVVINPDSTIKYVDILAFYEPLDYLPTGHWFDLFKKKILNHNLWPKRDIHNITGATLTVQAVTQGVRKMLAIYQIAVPKEESE